MSDNPGMDREMHKCPNCEMTWFERKMCPDCAFTGGDCAACGGTRDGGPADPHVCPEPYPFEQAQAIMSCASSRNPLVVSQRQRARILLGLRSRTPN
jgi:hypothetical protein